MAVVGKWIRTRHCAFPDLRDGLIAPVTVHDASFLEIVRRHLDFDAVSGEDADPPHAHAPGEVTENAVILCFAAQDPDREGRIGETLLYNADELNDILTQRDCGGKGLKKPKETTKMPVLQQAPGVSESPRG